MEKYRPLDNDDLAVIPKIALRLNNKYFYYKEIFASSFDDVRSLQRGALMIAERIIANGKEQTVSTTPTEMDDIEAKCIYVKGSTFPVSKKSLAKHFLTSFSKIINHKITTKPKNVVFLFICYLYWQHEMKQVSPSAFMSAVSTVLHGDKKKPSVSNEKAVSTSNYSPTDKVVRDYIRELSKYGANRATIQAFQAKAAGQARKEIKEIFDLYVGAIDHELELGSGEPI